MKQEPIRCPRCGGTDKVSPCEPLRLGKIVIQRTGCDGCGYRWNPKDFQNPTEPVKKP